MRVKLKRYSYLVDGIVEQEVIMGQTLMHLRKLNSLGEIKEKGS